jgi:parallel beta-helix repeat protein
MLTLLLIGVLVLSLNIKTTNAEPGTIIVPDNYPTIQQAINAANFGDTIFVRAGTYLENVFVNKPVYLVGESAKNTIIDGGRASRVITVLSGSVMITGFTITNCGMGAQSDSGIYLGGLTNVTIKNNHIMANNGSGILLYWSSNNTIAENTITINTDGIFLWDSYNNTIYRNNIMTNSRYGIHLFWSYNNTFRENDIGNNGCGVYLTMGPNVFYHNNFVNNIVQVSAASWNVWDDGYPSGGNYWSDYNGTDFYSGPYQNVTGSDGIGDTPYIINVSNQDNYPLMNPWINIIGIINITTFKTIVCQGYSLDITIKILNYGIKTETFNLTAYANAITIQTITNIVIPSGNSTTVTFAWNTNGFAKGNYTIWAYAWPVPGETGTGDNTFIDGIVKVTISGDVDGNGAVQLADIVTVAKAYGSKPGDSRWNPNADIDNNGIVSLVDLVIVAKNYGKTDP